MSDIILGIDPGGHGAIATLDESGQLITIEDMPVTREANGRHATNAPLVAEIFARAHARVIYCEFVGARPTDAKGVFIRKVARRARRLRRSTRRANRVHRTCCLETPG
jgi:hypothetical protein